MLPVVVFPRLFSNGARQSEVEGKAWYLPLLKCKHLLYPQPLLVVGVVVPISSHRVFPFAP